MSERGRRPGMGRGRRSPLPPYGDRARDKARPYPRRDDRFRDDGFLPPGGYDDPYGSSSRKRFDGDPYYDKGRFDEPFKGRPEPYADPYKDPYRDMMDPRRPNDCEIIVVNKQQRSYAEAVERRLKNIGMMVDLLFLKDEVLLTQTIDDISRRGSLYAVVVTQQHEAHGSVTLNILHGTPQEHRNMPLDDALRLVARNFHEYVQTQRDKLRDPVEGPYGAPSPLDREVQYLLNLLADGKYLSISELDRVIRYLQDRRDRMVGTEGVVPSKAVPPPMPPDMKPPDDDRSKPQDIQQRILNIINQPPSNSPMQQGAGMQPQGYGIQQPPPPQDMPQSQQQPSSTFLNFDNPNVKKALDSLIQSGPNLLKSIGMSSPSGGGGTGSSGMGNSQMGSSSQGGMMGSPHHGPPPMMNSGGSQMSGYGNGGGGGGGGGGQGYMGPQSGGSGGSGGGGGMRPMMGSSGGMMGHGGMMGGPRRY